MKKFIVSSVLAGALIVPQMLGTVNASSVANHATPLSNVTRANLYAFNAYTTVRGSNGAELKIYQNVYGDDGHGVPFAQLANIKHGDVELDAMYTPGHDNNVGNFNFDIHLYPNLYTRKAGTLPVWATTVDPIGYADGVQVGTVTWSKHSCVLHVEIHNIANIPSGYSFDNSVSMRTLIEVCGKNNLANDNYNDDSSIWEPMGSSIYNSSSVKASSSSSSKSSVVSSSSSKVSSSSSSKSSAISSSSKVQPVEPSSSSKSSSSKSSVVPSSSSKVSSHSSSKSSTSSSANKIQPVVSSSSSKSSSSKSSVASSSSSKVSSITSSKSSATSSSSKAQPEVPSSSSKSSSSSKVSSITSSKNTTTSSSANKVQPVVSSSSNKETSSKSSVVASSANKGNNITSSKNVSTSSSANKIQPVVSSLSNKGSSSQNPATANNANHVSSSANSMTTTASHTNQGQPNVPGAANHGTSSSTLSNHPVIAPSTTTNGANAQHGMTTNATNSQNPQGMQPAANENSQTMVHGNVIQQPQDKMIQAMITPANPAKTTNGLANGQSMITQTTKAAPSSVATHVNHQAKHLPQTGEKTTALVGVGLGLLAVMASATMLYKFKH